MIPTKLVALVIVVAASFASCLTARQPRIDESALVKKGDRYFLVSPGEPFSGVASGSSTGEHVVAWQYTYRAGQKHGEHLHWVDGKLYVKGYFDHGQYHGTFRSWYPNGEFRNVMRFRHGKPDGWCIDYDRNGRVYQRRLYRNGNLIHGETSANHVPEDTARKLADPQH